MTLPEGENTKPDPTILGRSSHLRILVTNPNTVHHPKEAATGVPTQWQGPRGEKYEARFESEQPELEPGVLNGEQVEWINTKDQPCTLIFDKEECPDSPFADGGRQFTIPPGQSVFSGLIRGKIRERYKYLVNFATAPNDGDGGDMGNPVIIVKGVAAGEQRKGIRVTL